MSGSLNRLIKDKQKAFKKNDLKEVATLCNVIGVELKLKGDYDGALEEVSPRLEEINVNVILQI